LEAAERRLRAGMQALLARQQHELAEEDAAVDPLAGAHATLDTQDHADRRIEEIEIAAKLFLHASRVAARYVEQRVELLADQLAAGIIKWREFLRGEVGFAPLGPPPPVGSPPGPLRHGPPPPAPWGLKPSPPAVCLCTRRRG